MQMRLEEILISFEKNFQLSPVFGVEFEFFSEKFLSVKEIVECSSLLNLTREKNFNQYELIYKHITNILLLVSLFNDIKKKSPI